MMLPYSVCSDQLSVGRFSRSLTLLRSKLTLLSIVPRPVAVKERLHTWTVLPCIAEHTKTDAVQSHSEHARAQSFDQSHDTRCFQLDPHMNIL
jgi:hypothetical protein